VLGKNMEIPRLYAPPDGIEEDSTWLWGAVWGLEGSLRLIAMYVKVERN